MFAPRPTATRLDHELIDIGDGRRLDRFGPIIVDRPCPPAERTPRRDPGSWRTASARFERSIDRGVVHAEWITADGQPTEPWTIGEGDLRFECRLASSGQVGVFPEQAPNRRWLADQAARASADPAAGGASGVLNVFAYTGGSTLASATGGVPVTHLDASRPAVAWARRNAELSGLADRPIRWISDDAIGFVRRELRRGRRYAGIVLDPPSYGHGEGGRDWRIERDLPGLLDTCVAMLPSDGPSFVLLTSHTTEVGPETLAGWLREALGAGANEGTIVDEPLELTASSGARLGLGWSVRWRR